MIFKNEFSILLLFHCFMGHTQKKKFFPNFCFFQKKNDFWKEKFFWATPWYTLPQKFLEKKFFSQFLFFFKKKLFLKRKIFLGHTLIVCYVPRVWSPVQTRPDLTFFSKIFSCDEQLIKTLCPSVSLLVCLFVCLFVSLFVC